MKTNNSIPTKESIKNQYLVNKYMKAQKNIIICDTILMGAAILIGTILINIL